MHDRLLLRGRFAASCYGRDGRLKWQVETPNTVVTQGRNDLLDTYFAGSGLTAAWYLGLIDGTALPVISANDTAASHAGWTENTAYVASTRPAATWAAASGGQKTTNAANFVMNATAAIGGLFLINNNTKAGATGILFAAAPFAGGTRNYVSGDTIVSTYTIASQ